MGPAGPGTGRVVEADGATVGHLVQLDRSLCSRGVAPPVCTQVWVAEDFGASGTFPVVRSLGTGVSPAVPVLFAEPNCSGQAGIYSNSFDWNSATTYYGTVGDAGTNFAIPSGAGTFFRLTGPLQTFVFRSYIAFDSGFCQSTGTNPDSTQAYPVTPLPTHSANSGPLRITWN